MILLRNASIDICDEKQRSIKHSQAAHRGVPGFWYISENIRLSSS